MDERHNGRSVRAGDDWGVIRDGRLASLHRTHHGAERAAGRDGLVLSVDPSNPLGLQLGDRCESFRGEAIPTL